MSIRTRLLLLVLAVLLPAMAAAAWVVAQALQSERSGLESGMVDATHKLAQLVDSELSRRASVARVLSTSQVLADAPHVQAEQLALFRRQAEAAMRGMKGWVELRDGQGVVWSTRPAGAAPPGEGAALPLQDRAVITPLRPDSSGGARVASAVEPVPGAGGTALNIGVTVLPEEMQAIVDLQRPRPDWVVTILDGQGQVLARQPGGAAYIGRFATANLMALMERNGEMRFQSVSLDGNPVGGYFRKTSQGWTVLTALPQPLLAGLPGGALPGIAGVAALLVLAIGGALLVAQRVAMPVYALKASAASLQAGEPVERRSTGIFECDQVNAALAEASEAILHAREDLERQVSDAVAQARAVEQRAGQNQRVEALGRLVGGVAHDFNNVLGIISNSAHLIKRSSHEERLSTPVKATLRAVDTGSRLTQHLLRFAGKQPVSPQLTNLAAVVPELRGMIETVLGSRVALVIAVAPDTGLVTIDANELELALINLALNVREALSVGGQMRIDVRNADRVDRDGLAGAAYALVAVSDNGQGADSETVERAFDPFFTTKSPDKGGGLGLSQVHGFCVQAGGAARMTSRPGLGTTVSMLLPVAALNAYAEPALAAAKPPPARDVNGAMVLLVEDNRELGEVTVALLESFGCVVVWAQDAANALLLCDSTLSFDVLLSDIVMPGELNGIELARELRRRNPSLPVVLVSGYSTARAAGTEFVVLTKPTPPDDLERALAAALQGVRPPRSS